MSSDWLHRGVVRVGEIDLFCLDTGSEGPPMLCLHGRWGRGETWIDLMRRYRDRYRILAPDHRGHGLSSKPRTGYAAEDLAADAHGLLRHHKCEPAIVVGHSMGARIAAYLTALHPESVRVLLLLDEEVSGPTERPNPSPDEIPQVDALTRDWPTPFACREDAVRFLRSRFKRETNVEYFLLSLAETPEGYDFLFDRRAMSALWEYREGWFHVLPKLRCPVLLARAAESLFLSKDEAELIREQIPDCTYVEIPDSDHMVYADNPGEFYPYFEEFLERTVPGETGEDR